MFLTPIQGTLRDKLKILRYVLLDSHKFLISFKKYLKYFNTQKIKYYLRYHMH